LTTVGWLRRRDRDLAALRRAARAAIVLPALLGVSKGVIGNADVATFAAFGSFAQLILVDFTGPIRDRLRAQAALALTGAAFICVGTLASRSAALAALSMGVVAFGVLFAGVVSSQLAGATTSLLLAYILPVSIPASAAEIPDRLAGWGMASGAALLAIALLWPAPVRNPLRAAAIAACRALAARLRAEDEATSARANDAVRALNDVFFATPYRPTGLSTAARTTVRLVDELKWLNDIVVQAAPLPDATRHPRVERVRSVAADVLDRSADLLEEPRRSAEPLREATARLHDELEALERIAMRRPAADEMVSALAPDFRAQELSFVVTQVAANVDLAAAAERRSWLHKLVGTPPAGLIGRALAVQQRAGAHAERHSLWLQNSLRGAVGLGLAALVANLSGVQHAFWVVLGTLSVLRSSALGTGQDVLRALLGTAAGFLVGALLVWLIGTDRALLWALLPPAVLLAGLAPAAVSFAAGQAAFTLTLVILFNILAPAGWQIGLVRIEDVAIGGAVSLAVGVLLWPRGAAAALGVALADAYVESARYLARAVDFGMGRCDSAARSTPEAPTTEALQATAASRRLDDTFREYLSDRGAKPVPLADVASLLTGVVGLRLAGDAILDLWNGADPVDGDRAAARRELVASTERTTGWYDGLAASLVDGPSVPEPLPPDEHADARLVEAVGRDLRSDDGEATATAVRMIWTGDHLDAARRLQGTLVGSARAVAGRAG
jgi:uncharacterized membrane protein YccC